MSQTNIQAFSGDVVVASNVGIGTMSPQVPLHILDSSDNSVSSEILRLQKGIDGTSSDIKAASGAYIGMYLEDDNAGGGEIARISYRHDGVDLGPEGTGQLGFWTSETTGEPGIPVERMTIRASGNVGIGRTNPLEPLHVEGNIRGDGDILMNGGTVFIRATGSNKVAIGENAGQTSQGSSAVAVGRAAGQSFQGADTVAVGHSAGNMSQGSRAVAVGDEAGQTDQGIFAVAVGRAAGQTSQGSRAVAVGHLAGRSFQGVDAVAVGRRAGGTSQGVDAVAVGHLAGDTNQKDNSIVINATGETLNNTEEGSLVIKPIRSLDGAGSNVLAYNASSGELIEGGTGAVILPVGTDAQRPDPAENGMVRFNTTGGFLEYYNGSWVGVLNSSSILATGGTITEITEDGLTFRVHTFTTIGTSTFSVLQNTNNSDIEYLIVGGGGGGGAAHTTGHADNPGAGGGGAGGIVTGTFSVSTQSYTVTVGNGGAERPGTTSPQDGNDGDPSSVFAIQAPGGAGGGKGVNGAPGRDGACGGGAGGNDGTGGTGSIGFNGGDSEGFNSNGGGGGGMGGAGQTGLSTSGGDGGDGLESSISGSPIFRGGGGGGGRGDAAQSIGGSGGSGGGGDGGGNGNQAKTGTPNTGSGGGGGKDQNRPISDGAAGGSGIVIIRYSIV